MKSIKYIWAGAFAALALSSTSVTANTVTSTSYGSFDVPQSGTFADIDIYNHSTGLWLGEAGFAGDGLDDLYFGENASKTQARFGGNSRDINGDWVNFLVFTNGPSDINDYSQGLAINFAGQSSIGADDIIFNGMNGSGALYNAGGVGPLDVAPSGVFGFMMEVYSGGGPACREDEVDCFDEIDLFSEGFGDEFYYGSLVTQHFGFLELSRGSVIGSTFGVNTVSGQAVTVAPVPLPATGLLLAGALGSIGLMRRRKKS